MFHMEQYKIINSWRDEPYHITKGQIMKNALIISIGKSSKGTPYVEAVSQDGNLYRHYNLQLPCKVGEPCVLFPQQEDELEAEMNRELGAKKLASYATIVPSKFWKGFEG